jgi:hypothetical protein
MSTQMITPAKMNDAAIRRDIHGASFVEGVGGKTTALDSDRAGGFEEVASAGTESATTTTDAALLESTVMDAGGGTGAGLDFSWFFAGGLNS